MAQIGNEIGTHTEVVGGADQNGLVTQLLTDSQGRVVVVAPATGIETSDVADGATNATAPLFAIQVGAQDGSGKLQPLNLDVSGNLKVTSTGGSAGTQYSDGTTQATPTGTVALGKNSSNVLHSLSLDGSGNLNVNLAAGTISGGNAAASATGSAVPASADYLGAKDGSGNLQGLLVESSTNPNLRVSVYNGTSEMPAGDSSAHSIHTTVDNASIAVTGTFWQTTQPVSGTFWQATQPVSGTVTANISGSISNTGFNVTPATSGGLSNSHLVSAGSTNATSVKASAGQVFGWSVFNNAAYPVYVKLFNKASAPTPGTDTPVMTIGVQAGTAREFSSDIGIAFGTGIGFAITKLIADNDNTAVLVSDCILDLLYK